MIQLAPIVLAQVVLMAGGPVTVKCQNDIGRDRVGEALIAQRVIRVNASECVDLNRFARHPRLPGLRVTTWGYRGGKGAMDYVGAFLVLAHEAEHIGHQDADEARSTCRGLTDVPIFARALGAKRATAARASRLARQWTRENLPNEYQSACTR